MGKNSLRAPLQYKSRAVHSKNICLKCRKDVAVRVENENLVCVHCGSETKSFYHSFRPPKKTCDNKWRIIEEVIRGNGHVRGVHSVLDAKTLSAYLESCRDYSIPAKNKRRALAP